MSMTDEIPRQDPQRSRDLIEENLYLALLKSKHLLERDLRTLFQQYDLTHRQYNILRILYVRDAPGLSCQQLRHLLFTQVSDISRLIDRMVEKDLVERTRGENDRRVVLISLTKRGEQRCEQVDNDLISLQKDQFNGLGDQEKRQLLKSLTTLSESLQSISEGGEK